MHSQSNIIILISIIAVIKESSCAPHHISHPHSHCHHQYNSHRYPLHTSQWEHELSENFSPIIDDVDDSRIHIQQLRDKIANLFSIIQEMKDDFTRETLNKPYNKIDFEESEKHYSELSVNNFGEDDVSNAYSLFQKLHIASEIVLIDLMNMNVHKANGDHLYLWTNIKNYSLSIIKQLHIEMKINKKSISLLPRSELPDTIRCVRDSSTRDKRNFFILRHMLEASRKYLNVF